MKKMLLTLSCAFCLGIVSTFAQTESEQNNQYQNQTAPEAEEERTGGSNVVYNDNISGDHAADSLSRVQDSENYQTQPAQADETMSDDQTDATSSGDELREPRGTEQWGTSGSGGSNQVYNDITADPNTPPANTERAADDDAGEEAGELD